MPYVIVFDGVCNLCNGVVRFIIERDPRRKFRFAPMQRDAGREMAERCHAPAPADGLDTFLLITDETCLVRSDAALAIARELTWPWPLCGVLRFVPKAFRDLLYDLVARNRYRLFGRRPDCMVPGPDVRDRFLDA